MSFGEAFGRLIKKKRGHEGLTQQELAVRAFGDESYKTRISELENGRVSRPQQKTVDLLVIALQITEEEVAAILGENPHAQYVDTLFDFFDVSVPGSVHIEVAVNDSGMGVVFHNKPLKFDLKRVEYFVEESSFVLLTKCGRRRHTGLPITNDVRQNLALCDDILFVHRDQKTGKPLSGKQIPFKLIS